LRVTFFARVSVHTFKTEYTGFCASKVLIKLFSAPHTQNGQQPKHTSKELVTMKALRRVAAGTTMALSLGLLALLAAPAASATVMVRTTGAPSGGGSSVSGLGGLVSDLLAMAAHIVYGVLGGFSM
jgi:hypothetical protein